LLQIPLQNQQTLNALLNRRLSSYASS